jgi:hypothetical protein
MRDDDQCGDGHEDEDACERNRAEVEAVPGSLAITATNGQRLRRNAPTIVRTGAEPGCKGSHPRSSRGRPRRRTPKASIRWLVRRVSTRFGETHHATDGEETDADGCVRRLRASDRRPDGVESRGPEPADHEQDEDDPELGSNANQAQERGAVKTPTHPITRKPTSSRSAPKTGCVTEEAIRNTATITARVVVILTWQCRGFGPSRPTVRVRGCEGGRSL